MTELNQGVTELAHEEDAESARIRLQADRDRWYELAMDYLKRLQELEVLLAVIKGNVGKAHRLAQGKDE